MAHIYALCVLNWIYLNSIVLRVVYKWRLKVAACLGPNFDAEVLEKAKKDGDIDDSFLESCDGFLRNVPGSKKYVWAHDQIQQGMLPWMDHMNAL